MTRTGAAARLGQDRLDLVAEIPFERFFHLLDDDFGLGYSFSNPCCNRGLAVRDRKRNAILNLQDLRVARDEADVVGDLANELFVTESLNDEQLVSGLSAESKLLGNH